MDKNRHYKAINFDLSTAKLKKFYPNKNYRQAYADIKISLSLIWII
jgi:virulence-associated protein VapD